MIDYLVNSQLVLYSLIAIAGCAIVWHFMESRWDSRNFNKDEKGVFENLHTRMALYAYEHVDGIVPVDVRSMEEFLEGHIPRAINAVYHDHQLDTAALREINTDTPILLYCEGGYNSRLAIELLKEMGFHTIYHIHRGFKSWKFFGGDVARGTHTAMV